MEGAMSAVARREIPRWEEAGTITDAEFERLMSGETIFGDDLTEEEIRRWYADEEHASFDIYGDVDTSQYDALNREHGFSRLLAERFGVCVALGTADGKDVAPLAPRVERYVAIEPEEKWWKPTIGGRPARFLKPAITGRIPMADGEADLAVALGVLHHIPNVSFVISELGRVVRSGGELVLREPVVAMGDWRRPRKGLSRRERGLPPGPFLRAVEDAGFRIRRTTLYDCPATIRACRLLRVRHPFDRRAVVLADKWLSAALRWNMHYRATNVLQKIAPASMFIVAQKR